MNEGISIARHFSKASGRYAREAEAQRRFAEKLDSRLPLLPDGARILEIGCGTGFLTELLMKRYPTCALEGIDISAAMLGRVQAATAENAGLLRLHHGDIRNFSFSRQFELVTSCSAIHWIPPYEDLFTRVYDLLAENGCFFFSMMLQGTLGELHELRRELFPHKVPRAEMPTFAEVSANLAKAGFAVSTSEKDNVIIRYSNATSFFECIRGAGLTGGAFSTGAAPLTRTELRLLSAAYQSRYSVASGEVQASYHSAMFCAVRAGRNG